MLLTRNSALVLILLLTAPGAWCSTGGSPMKPPADPVLTEARALVNQMKNNERGPYSRIRWFCEDGSVLPPEAFACSKRGGGRQHAEYSPERRRLADLGWHAGTVFAALSWDEFWGEPPRRLRLRELPLERFMLDSDDGWVLRRARDYRGRVQVEDEEAAGRALLLRLMNEREWLGQNFLLTRQLVQTLPNASAEDRTYRVRHLAQAIAEKDQQFNRLRIEIHSRPNSGSAGRVRSWVATRTDLSPQLRKEAEELAAGLDNMYGEVSRQARLKKAEQSLSRSIPEVASLLAEARNESGNARISRLARALAILRKHIPVKDPVATLYRLNLMQALETELRVAASEHLSGTQLSRQDLMALASDLLQGAWATGFMSDGELAALQQPLQDLMQRDTVGGNDYALGVRRLSLAAAWAAATVRYTFSEALLRYSALDRTAERFVDQVLRSSLLLPLGEVAHRLALDGAEVAGLTHQFFGRRTGQLLGINPGVARARLRVLSSDDLARGVQAAADEIVVLPETVAELTPVAGILTLGEGNPLSHVQMLARNLGIPNVVVGSPLLDRLQEEDGRPVLLAVSADGRVYLERQAALPALPGAEKAQPQAASALVVPPQPDLAYRQPLVLADLHAGLSGKVVGPKAANVGQLARLFPGRIAPAVALPFGVFADYTPGQRERVAQAYAQFRGGALEQAGLDAVLDQVRAEVSGMRLDEALQERLRSAMSREFGDTPGYGLFVRSDTNVEDLPQFTGAGLNETVPNVVGMDAQFAAIPRVWASVYSRRAMAWRGRILKNPDQVFASILLMKSVPAEKSGVMVTTDLYAGQGGLTVSTAWGVGGAVDNESAASLVLRDDGGALLLAEAKAPYRRTVDPRGGISWLPAGSGPVLTADEQQDLRKLAAEVIARYPPSLDDRGQALPWDIEFAFAQGKLWLLQIRPLVQRGQVEATRLIGGLLPASVPAGQVSLSETPHTAVEEK